MRESAGRLLHRIGALGIAAACLFASGAARAEEAAKPVNSSMRIQQQMAMGDFSNTTDYRAQFQQDGKFRVDGKMTISAMQMEMTMQVASDGKTIKQLVQTPFGPQAVTLDLERISKAIPGYDPAKTYDPTAYQDMIKGVPEKRALEALTLDGAPTEGHEVDLPGGRLSLPSNVPLALPDPAKIRVWINPKDNIARRVELEDAQGKTFMKMDFTEVKTGVSFTPETFDLEFPPGVTPVDQTSLILGMVEASRQPPATPAPK